MMMNQEKMKVERALCMGKLTTTKTEQGDKPWISTSMCVSEKQRSKESCRPPNPGRDSEKLAIPFCSKSAEKKAVEETMP